MARKPRFPNCWVYLLVFFKYLVLTYTSGSMAYMQCRVNEGVVCTKNPGLSIRREQQYVYYQVGSRQDTTYPSPGFGWKDGTMSCSDDVVGTCRVDGDAASKIATGLSVPGSL